MTDLINQFKEEHVRIMHLFEALKGDLKKNKSEIIKDLQELREVLVHHLDLEDKLLYPKFSQSEQPEVKKIGQLFSEEMGKISKVAFSFFDKYEGKEVDQLVNDKKFKNLFEEISKKVEKRVKIEEEVLYPAFNMYFGKK